MSVGFVSSHRHHAWVSEVINNFWQRVAGTSSRLSRNARWTADSSCFAVGHCDVTENLVFLTAKQKIQEILHIKRLSCCDTNYQKECAWGKAVWAQWCRGYRHQLSFRIFIFFSLFIIALSSCLLFPPFFTSYPHLHFLNFILPLPFLSIIIYFLVLSIFICFQFVPLFSFPLCRIYLILFLIPFHILNLFSLLSFFSPLTSPSRLHSPTCHILLLMLSLLLASSLHKRFSNVDAVNNLYKWRPSHLRSCGFVIRLV
jgi:hypothetical protein